MRTGRIVYRPARTLLGVELTRQVVTAVVAQGAALVVLAAGVYVFLVVCSSL